MRHAAFLLVGGESRRMGRNKALLAHPAGGTLLTHGIAVLQEVVDHVALLGDPDQYGFLGWPVLTDRWPGTGPFGALCTALAHTEAEWNVVLACDLPGVPTRLLRDLLSHAESHSLRCVLAAPDGEWQPLCAVYHRSCQEHLEAALAAGERSVRRAVARLEPWPWTDLQADWLANVNTPAEWETYRAYSASPPFPVVPANHE